MYLLLLVMNRNFLIFKSMSKKSMFNLSCVESYSSLPYAVRMQLFIEIARILFPDSDVKFNVHEL